MVNLETLGINLSSLKSDIPLYHQQQYSHRTLMSQEFLYHKGVCGTKAVRKQPVKKIEEKYYIAIKRLFILAWAQISERK